MEKYLQNIDYQLIKQIIFFIFAGITVGGALYLLFTKNVLYAAYSLLLTLLGVSGLYVFAGADFLAVSQIMIYVGGILVLMVFGIMLTHNKDTQHQTNQANKISVSHHNVFWAVLVATLLFLGYLKVILEANFNIIGKQTIAGSSVQKIGINLMTDYVFAFEVIGILLLAALIGAVFIAKKEKSWYFPAIIFHSNMIYIQNYLIISALLFSIGFAVVVTKRNAILILMGIELMLNAVNLNLVSFSQYDPNRLQGQMFALFVMVISAAEVTIALAIIMKIYDYFKNLDLDEINQLKN